MTIGNTPGVSTSNPALYNNLLIYDQTITQPYHNWAFRLDGELYASHAISLLAAGAGAGSGLILRAARERIHVALPSYRQRSIY